jgi:hypothetical protein
MGLFGCISIERQLELIGVSSTVFSQWDNAIQGR